MAAVRIRMINRLPPEILLMMVLIFRPSPVRLIMDMITPDIMQQAAMGPQEMAALRTAP